MLDSKSDKDIFLGYSRNGRAYRVLNNQTKSMMESINVIMDDIQYKVFSQEEDDLTIPEQHVLPNAPDKKTNFLIPS